MRQRGGGAGRCAKEEGAHTILPHGDQNVHPHPPSLKHVSLPERGGERGQMGTIWQISALTPKACTFWAPIMGHLRFFTVYTIHPEIFTN